MIYEGPVIDVHNHLWDYGMGRHKWLGQPVSALRIVGDSRYLERDYLPGDYAADFAGQNVVATVHVEAHWDRSRDGLEETEWLESLLRPANVANRYVVWAELAREGAQERLKNHLSRSRRVIGVRESIREHPDPAYGYAGSANWQDPVWQAGVTCLGKYDLVLELMIYPHQANAVCSLARLFPDQIFVINHSASPIGAGVEARRQFETAIRKMAECPNVFIKVSNFFRYSEDLTYDECLQTIARPCIETFGPTRAMFASDFPVASKWLSYARLMETLKGAISDLTADEQRAFFHDSAANVYRLTSER